MRRVPLNTLAALITLIGGIGAGLVFPILPALGLKLGLSGFLVGLILASNRIARLIFNLPAGHLYPRFGPRLTLTGALLLETIGMLGFSIALSSPIPGVWLLAGRFVHGTGMAFLLVGAQATALENSDKSNRGRQTAAIRVAINAAMPAGLVLGGILADLYSDNVAFLTGSFISLIGAILAGSLLPSRELAHRQNPDHAGQPSPNKDLAAARIDRSILALLRSQGLPALASAWSFNFLISLTVQGALLATLVLLIEERHVSIFRMEAQGTSAMLMAVMIGIAAVSAFTVGRTIDALPLRSTPLFPCLLGLVAGFAIIALAHSLPSMLLGAVITGLSYNSITVPMMALLGDTAGERWRSHAVAVFQWCGDVGGTIGPIMGIEMATRLGLTSLYMSMAAVCALAIGVAMRLQGYEQRNAAAR